MMKIFKFRSAFTLAEVLIVIGVIGVVAAITIPTLIPLIKDKVDTNRKEVIEDRLIQGFNQLNTLDDGFNGSQYAQTGTEGFVRALSKHYKMSQICGAENLKNCFPYAEFTYEKDNELKTFKIEDLKSAKNFSLSEDEWHAPAGFISAQGTPFIMLLKKDCIMDTGEGMRGIPTSCVQYMYDNNGSNIPNRLGGSYDIQSSGLVKIDSGKRPADGTLASAIDGYKTYLILNYDHTGGTSSGNGINTCDKKDEPGGGGDSYCSNNRWAAAVEACKAAGYDLPTKEQLQELYCRVNGKSNPYYSCSSTAKDYTLATKVVTSNNFFSSSPDGSDYAYSVNFYSGYASFGNVSSSARVLCLGK